METRRAIVRGLFTGARRRRADRAGGAGEGASAAAEMHEPAAADGHAEGEAYLETAEVAVRSSQLGGCSCFFPERLTRPATVSQPFAVSSTSMVPRERIRSSTISASNRRRARRPRDLRRLRRSDPAQAAAGALQPVARPAAAGPVRRRRRRPQRDDRRAVPPAVPGQPARVREGRRGAATRWRARCRRRCISSPARWTIPACTPGWRSACASIGSEGVLFYLAIPPAVYGTVVEGLGAAGLAGTPETGLAPRDRREAVRHRPGERAEPQRAAAPALHGRADLPHRSLPREGDRPEPAGAAVRQRDVRADLEPPLHRSGADHRGRDRRRGAPRVVLRGGRRAARHGAEPPDAAAGAGGDGAADRVHCRERARSEDGCAARGAAVRRRRRADRRSCAAQYREGWVDGAEVPAYRDGARRARRARRPRPSSRCGSMLDSWRWAGVPFYLRTGKRLPEAHHRDRDPVPPAAAADLPRASARRRCRPTCW